MAKLADRRRQKLLQSYRRRAVRGTVEIKEYIDEAGNPEQVTIRVRRFERRLSYFIVKTIREIFSDYNVEWHRKGKLWKFDTRRESEGVAACSPPYRYQVRISDWIE